MLAAILCVSALSAAATPAACLTLSPPTDQAAALTQASARRLAGLASGGVDATRIAEQAFWQAHARAMDAAWLRTSERHLANWRSFAAREIDAQETSRQALFYPFSGPDVGCIQRAPGAANASLQA